VCVCVNLIITTYLVGESVLFSGRIGSANRSLEISSRNLSQKSFFGVLSQVIW
jgi:hypothetical protein